MRQSLQDQERLCGVDAALDELVARRPPLTDIATSYALLLKARLAASAALPKNSLLGADLSAQNLADSFLAAGRPLLSDIFAGLAKAEGEIVERFLTAAQAVLPATAQAFPRLAKDLARVAVLLDAQVTGEGKGVNLAAALLAAIGPTAENAATPKTIEDIAGEIGVEPAAVHMATTETLLALLAHEGELLAGLVNQEAWRRNYCPVCGGGADVGILKEGKEDSEFLIAKAGQLWLHCGQCATLWRFPRLRCVACGCEDPAKMDMLLAEDDPRAEQERAHLCNECRTYSTTVNLVDRSDRVNLEMLPMTLLHLELLAQERGFSPLAPTPWNTLT